MGWLLNYFNLSVTQGSGINEVVTPPQISLGWQLALYGALIVGILASGLLAALRSGHKYRFQSRRVLVACIIGLSVFPAVYQGAQANLGQPSLIQLALVFSTGLGYESLFSGVVALAGGKDSR